MKTVEYGAKGNAVRRAINLLGSVPNKEIIAYVKQNEGFSVSEAYVAHCRKNKVKNKIEAPFTTEFTNLITMANYAEKLLTLCGSTEKAIEVIKIVDGLKSNST